MFGSLNLTYDAEGRQISAMVTGSATITYAYDGLAERVTKSVAGGITTTYVHDVFGTSTPNIHPAECRRRRHAARAI